MTNKTTWQPIETAPSETRVLVYGGSGPMRFGVKDKLGNWRAIHHGPVKCVPTHWMPLPEVPHAA